MSKKNITLSRLTATDKCPCSSCNGTEQDFRYHAAKKPGQKAIDEFKQLYLSEYGVSLTDNQALEYSMRLIAFVKAVYGKSLPKLPLDLTNHLTSEDRTNNN